MEKLFYPIVNTSVVCCCIQINPVTLGCPEITSLSSFERDEHSTDVSSGLYLRREFYTLSCD